MKVCTPNGEALVKGTSFAAPWISRKLAYLINVLGLNRNIAKALLINSATGWDIEQNNPELVGHGIVPKRIEDIVYCADDEIQFVIQGTSELYNTYKQFTIVSSHVILNLVNGIYLISIFIILNYKKCHYYYLIVACCSGCLSHSGLCL